MLFPSRKITAVIPAFNEARTIEGVVRSVRECVDEVIVVDDGSTDATAEGVRRAGGLLIRHERNAGYDRSLSDGFRMAVDRGADVIVSCDADGQHRPEDVARVIEPLTSGRASMGIGERQELTRFGEKVFARFVRRYGVRDPLCGLKAYRREVYEAVGYFDTVGSIGTELMLTALKLGFSMARVPIEVVPRADTSRFYRNVIRGNVRILRAMVRVLLKIAWVRPSHER